MVNLEWYRTFKAIYQHGTLTKAAQELMISQPNASVQLASLESYIGKPLFVRFPRQMKPTEYGQRLYTQIVESIDNLERVEMEFKRTVISKAPDIRFGTPPEIFNNYLAEEIGQLDLNLTVVYGLANELTDRLIGNCVDIAIITRQSKTDDSIVYEPLITESLMLFCNPNLDTSEFDACVASESMTKVEAWLKEQKWYVYNNDLSLLRRFWRENFKKRPLVRLQAVIPDYNSIFKAMAHNNALTASSDLIARKSLEQGLTKVLWKGNVPATNTLYLAYNKNKIAPQYVDMIRTFVLKYAFGKPII